MTELEALISLNQVPRTGPVRIRRLLEFFGDAVSVLKASPGDLSRVKGIGPETATLIASWQEHADPSSELSLAAERDIRILDRAHPDYPAALRDAFDAPPLLYVWGTLEERDRHSISIVGSRRLTHYGRDTARKFSYQLASAGLTIISGLARGIDTAAHEGAVAAEGRTIAVLGSGLMQVYPPENMDLATRIASGQGAVVSEFPLRTPPDRQTFPQRNRIVAHWGSALLVVESPARSGSLITANLAIEANRQLYAVPGPIDRPTSAGCHQLIRDGATLVTDPSQILADFQELPLQDTPDLPARPQPDLSPEEKIIHAALTGNELSLDELSTITGQPVSTLAVHLMRMELNQMIITLPGQRYRLRGLF